MKAISKKPQRQVRKSKKSASHLRLVKPASKSSAKFIRSETAKARRDRGDENGRKLIDVQSRLRDIQYDVEKLSQRDGMMGLSAISISKIDFLVNCAYHDALDHFDTHLKAALVNLEAAANEALNAGFYALNPAFQTRARSRNG